MRLAATFAIAGCVLVACSTEPLRATQPVQVQILAINDFHGNLLPPRGGIRIKDPTNPGKTIDVAAGGSEYLATAVAQLRAKNPNHVFVAAGDLIGASPLLSALFHDEPTVDALSLMGLEVSAVGNHEFDHGAAELLRMQNGGCNPSDGCKGPQPFKGASFKYLAASTFDTKSGQTIFPPYFVKRFEGVPVAFIGLTLKGTPDIVVPSGVAGLRFDDEAETVNRLVPELQRQGIGAIVVLIHEGGFPTGDYNECPGISGAIVDIVKKFDKAVDLIISGHTHKAYNCRIDGRLVTSGDKYGTIVSEIDIVLDPKSGHVTQARADNLIVRNDTYAKDPQQTRLIGGYEKLAAPLAKRVVGRIAAPLTREESAAGESALGDVVADAQLVATRSPADGGAQIAMMNPGGLRANLIAGSDGAVHYEDLFTVQPFYNNLVTLTLSGAQVLQVLEQQWQSQPERRILQVSRGFAYTWDAARPVGQRVVPGSVTLDGQALDMAANYRVTVNSFLADGGDRFTVFRQGRDAKTGAMDVDAFEQFIARRAQGEVAPLDRIKRIN